MKSGMNELLNQLRVCDFVFAETSLYLDSRPNDIAALAYYREYLPQLREAAAAYACKYGMLTAMDEPGKEHWPWTDGPWPWDYREA